jgi:hypothetical protein
MPRARSSGDDEAPGASVPHVAGFALPGWTHSHGLPVSRARLSRQLRQAQLSWLPPTFVPWTVRFGLATRKPRPWSAPHSSPREVSPCSRLGLSTWRMLRTSVPGEVAEAGFLLTLPTGGLATRAARTGTALPPAAPASTPPATPSPDTPAECRAAGFVWVAGVRQEQ